MLIEVGEFIFPVDFVAFDIKRVPTAESHIPIILRCLFLATLNALINCRNDMMKLSFRDMTLNLNIFNL